MYLLLVEDDLGLGQALHKLLLRHYRVHWVRSLASARRHFDAAEYDAMLLDLGLPDGDGVDWLRTLRAEGCLMPVLIISARDQLDDRVKGLDTGADDYLVKPFEPDELLARIRVLLRRQSGVAQPRITSGALSFATESRQFYLSDEAVNFSPKEHQILAVLIQAGGKPVSRERLTQQLYGLGDAADSNTLEVHIHALRKVLGKDRIETLRGFGYRLVAR
ncbi:MAG: response regulator [Gammaproteobacteria bacterium]|nr:response regulator [Gammaproteobacteria bacterium]